MLGSEASYKLPYPVLNSFLPMVDKLELRNPQHKITLGRILRSRHAREHHGMGRKDSENQSLRKMVVK